MSNGKQRLRFEPPKAEVPLDVLFRQNEGRDYEPEEDENEDERKTRDYFMNRWPEIFGK